MAAPNVPSKVEAYLLNNNDENTIIWEDGCKSTINTAKSTACTAEPNNVKLLAGPLANQTITSDPAFFLYGGYNINCTGYKVENKIKLVKGVNGNTAGNYDFNSTQTMYVTNITANNWLYNVTGIHYGQIGLAMHSGFMTALKSGPTQHWYARIGPVADQDFASKSANFGLVEPEVYVKNVNYTSPFKGIDSNSVVLHQNNSDNK